MSESSAERRLNLLAGRIQNLIDHAEANNQVLSPESQGVGPGELRIAVDAEALKLCLKEDTETVERHGC